MSHTLLFWLSGGLLLVGAGFVTTLLPRSRAQRRDRGVAWSAARAEIETASVSRDATPHRVPEAERLLARAEMIAAGGGGVTAAEAAAGYARQADRLWREHG